MKQIFIVEDDHDIRELLELILVNEEYEVKSFPTAEDFKKGIVSSEKPDLILMDIRLPDGNGVELCRGLCDDQQTSNIPVFLMSAHAKADISTENCAKDFIPKPFDVDDLLARVQKQVQ